MLHQGILPQHARWNRFFTHLRYVVLDEVHAYRGVLGSHVANVLRRLHRVCRHYGSRPQFVCSSATIANPREHAERICGVDMELVTSDGSPRGPKWFVLWNPPLLAEERAAGSDWKSGGERRSALWEATELMTALVRDRIQTIAFVRTRLASELIYHRARQLLGGISTKLADAVHAYRGGYLPEERRDIERRLASAELLGVASTNALELGIDIGSLDAAILVGYPGTIASMWQQAGRAGRGADEALVFLVAQNAPIDQYLMSDWGYLFRRSSEQAVIDPDNPHISIGHLKSAVFELPVEDDEAVSFGEYAEPMLELLDEDKSVSHLDGRWYWARTDYPAAEVNLRNISGAVYTIQDASQGNQVIGTMDEVSALSQLHDHAVYMHGAETYFVERLDFENKIALADKRDLDYYTQAITVSRIKIDSTEEENPWRRATVAFGDVTVTTTIPMFKKIKFDSRDSLGFENLEMPPQSLETVALWLVPPEDAVERVRGQGRVFGEGLVGIANAMIEVAPMFVMCDVQDIGVVVDSSNLGRDALFLYDRYPGGMGYAERCAAAMEQLMQSIYTVISNCPCRSGCPSCVGSATPAFALGDLDSGTRGRIPDKDAALMILHELLELGPYTPQAPPPSETRIEPAAPSPEGGRAASRRIAEAARKRKR
jgi:DEAD/DEAH box helicase domain-containing protein